MSKKKPKHAAINAETYKNLVDLQAVHNEAIASLEAMEAEVRKDYITKVDGVRKKYTTLQATITKTEAAIEYIARKNPTWFEEARTVKTPYGTIKFVRSKKLEAVEEERSLALIEAKNADYVAKYIRVKKELNLDALKDLTDEELMELGIVRVVEDNCSIKPATIDLGKAVKEAIDKAEGLKEAA